jgi:MFS family permease
MREVLGAGGPLLLAFAFLLYAVQYYAMSNLLPTFFVDRMGLSLATAGLISAGVILVNGLGNISAGFILSLGGPVWCIVAVVFCTIGISGFAIFSEASSAPVAIAAAALCFGVAALLPASVIASMPSLSPTPRRLALSIGLVQQASSTGQAFGPAILAYWVQRTEWSGVPHLFAIIGLLGLLGAAALRRVLGRSS